MWDASVKVFGSLEAYDSKPPSRKFTADAIARKESFANAKMVSCL
uniref:Uncharacterized protein n=1 Tax=Ascaris lumbricoides TaxID=6252 RepID=A0A0M3HFA9_ASCLU